MEGRKCGSTSHNLSCTETSAVVPHDLTEDYIWAMRTSIQQDSDSELWKDRRATPLNSLTVTHKKSKRAKNVLSTPDDYNVKVMASLVPDEIIYNVNNYSIRKYDACLLFGDVSGEGTPLDIE